MSDAPRLILASASPRRRELLACLGVPFAVQPSGVDEPAHPEGTDPAAFAAGLAQEKALDVARGHPDAIVLAADTIVVLDRCVLDKPETEREAWDTLRALRARDHQVITAVAVAQGNNVESDAAVSIVWMRSYTDDEITAYIASGDPFDKAGAYAIQNPAFMPVERLDGCHCNVVGLPLIETWGLLRRAGLEIPVLDFDALPPACRSCPLREA